MSESCSSNLNELVAALDSSVTADLVAGLELRMVTRMIERGALERAEALLTSVAERLDGAEELALSNAWDKLGREWLKLGQSDRAEQCLRRAVRYGSEAAGVALARYLERVGRTQEAIAQWREITRAYPGRPSHYVGLARMYELTGDVETAVATYLELADAAPSLATYLMIAERLESLERSLPAPQPTRAVHIALLGNATLDHLHSFLTVESYRAGLRPSIYQAGFDQFTQEILNPSSGLYASEPDVVVLAVHASRLFPRLHDYPFDLSIAERRAEIDAGLHLLQHLFNTLSEHTNATILVHNMVIPQHPALGVLDQRDELGQTAAFTEINIRLAEMARTRYRGVYVVDEERVQARCGKANATDPRMWLTARMPWSEPVLAGLAREYMRYLRAARGLARKCIVLDLDNTLWGGVVGEDGMAGIHLGSEAPGSAFLALQKELDKLWRRGILLAVCSKNNPEDALQVIDHHPDMVLRASRFAAMRINWQPKADNIRDIARELNIGLDSLVFLDDSPVERASVRAALPQVHTPELPTDPAGYRRALLDMVDLFDTLELTDEDRNRNKLYAEQRERQAAQEHLGSSGSLDEYLADLAIVIEIEPMSILSLPRVAQLTNKTNQFNLTTRRYTEAEIASKERDGWLVVSARVRDRFGDNGLTGVAIVDATNATLWSIDTLLLSCRVLGRGVESALLAWLAEEARRAGARQLRGQFIPTAKNSVVRYCYRDHGFEIVDEGPDGASTWELDLHTASITVPAWLTVRVPGTAPAG